MREYHVRWWDGTEYRDCWTPASVPFRAAQKVVNRWMLTTGRIAVKTFHGWKGYYVESGVVTTAGLRRDMRWLTRK